MFRTNLCTYDSYYFIGFCLLCGFSKRFGSILPSDICFPFHMALFRWSCACKLIIKMWRQYFQCMKTLHSRHVTKSLSLSLSLYMYIYVYYFCAWVQLTTLPFHPSYPNDISCHYFVNNSFCWTAHDKLMLRLLGNTQQVYDSVGRY